VGVPTSALRPKTVAASGEHRYLGELQAEIMEIAWARDRVAVRDVLTVLHIKRTIAYTTVMTVMTRLAEQGILSRERVGKADYYRPACTREQLRARISGNIVNSLVADFGDVALSQFLDVLGRVDAESLARLVALAQGENPPDAAI
jgi:predicted transcriptional regulator